MDCSNCKLLNEVIDELSLLLSRSERSRREAMRTARQLRRLMIMDMEIEHDFPVLCQEDSAVLEN